MRYTAEQLRNFAKGILIALKDAGHFRLTSASLNHNDGSLSGHNDDITKYIDSAFEEQLESLDQERHRKIRQEEFIVCAAICDPEEKDITGDPLIHCGLRHCYILHQSRSISRNPYHQGFLTNRNRFVNRKEGLEIAIKQNQILDKDDIRGSLFSEDLY